MILKQYVVGEIFQTNNYLLIDEKSKEAVLIDCAGGFESVNKDLKAYGAKLKYILLTHGHFDHVGGCAEFKEKLNPELLAHEDDSVYLQNVKTQCDYFSIPAFATPKVDKYIDENTELFLGEHPIKIFHTKGHTKGGLSYLVDGKLFSGDTLFFEEVGRCDLPGGDFEEIKKSIKEKLFLLPDDTEVYPGHGGKTAIGHEKKHNPYTGSNG